MERVAGLLLAAGGGRRVGAPKALLRQGDQLLVERAVGVLRQAGCAPVVVVLGAGAEQVLAEADLGEAVVVVNPAWGTGLGSSLRAGLEALEALPGTPVDAAAVLLVDTPGVTAEAVRRVAALPYAQALVCATYGGRRGHPMLLGRAHWAGIAALAKADVGARAYLMAHTAEVVGVSCDGVGSDDDIDTPEMAASWGITLPEHAVPAADPVDPGEHRTGPVAVQAPTPGPGPGRVGDGEPGAAQVRDPHPRAAARAHLRVVPAPRSGGAENQARQAAENQARQALRGAGAHATPER